MAGESIFFTQLPPDVIKALDARKSIYSATNRARLNASAEDAYNWLYKKMAYCNVYSSYLTEVIVSDTITSNITGTPASNIRQKRVAGPHLTAARAGGYTANGRYSKEGNSSSSDSAIYYPKPHLTSCKISTHGDFGSLRKAQFAFAVYSITELDAFLPMMSIGADITIEYGWTIKSSATGNAGRFDGKVYNFSYQVNSTGGFDCTCDVVGAGQDVLRASANMTSNILDITATNAYHLTGNTFMSSLQTMINSYIDSSPQSTEPTVDGKSVDGSTPIIAGISYADFSSLSKVLTGNQSGATNDDGESALTRKNIDSNGNWTGASSTTSTKQYYISLGGLISLINKGIQTARLGDVGKVKLICNKEVTTGLIPDKGGYVDYTQKSTGKTAYPTGITEANNKAALQSSANKVKLISAEPTKVLFPGFTEYLGSGNGQVFSFGSYDSKFENGDLSSIMLNVEFVKESFSTVGSTDSTKAVKTINDVLHEIFTVIYDNSGTRFQLSPVVNYPDKSKQSALAEVRIVDVNYIPSTPPSVYEITAVKQDSICRSVSLQSKVPSELATANFIAPGSDFIPVNGGFTRVLTAGGVSKTQHAISPNIDKVLQYYSTDFKPELTEELKSAVKAEFVNTPTGKNGNHSIIYPIELSITMDGIDGMQFGNTIKTNYLPSIYKTNDQKIAFTITTIEHDISGNDWKTTINTACRIIPDNVK